MEIGKVISNQIAQVTNRDRQIEMDRQIDQMDVEITLDENQRNAILRWILREIDFPTLDQAKMQKINQWMDILEPEFEVVIQKFDKTIYRRDIRTLQWNPPEPVSEDVFSFYLNLIVERSRLDESLPTVYALSVYDLEDWQDMKHPNIR